jgi:hypothetical protein
MKQYFKKAKSIFMVGAVALFVWSCAPYKLFTVGEREEVDDNIGKLQLYIDTLIEIRRVVTQEDDPNKRLQGGVLTKKKGISYYTLVFDEKLGGLAKAESEDDYVYVRFDEGDTYFLTFKNYGDDDFYHLAGRVDKSTNAAYVTYGGFNDYEVLKGSRARLLMKRSDRVKVKKQTSKAKGVYIK